MHSLFFAKIVLAILLLIRFGLIEHLLILLIIILFFLHNIEVSIIDHTWLILIVLVAQQFEVVYDQSSLPGAEQIMDAGY